jgi:hypothetical protein
VLWEGAGWGGKGGCWGKRGEMTQTLYAHMIKKEVYLGKLNMYILTLGKSTNK